MAQTKLERLHEFFEQTRFRQIDVTQTSDQIRILIYGDHGVGKTYLAASAADVPDMSPVLFIDCDQGLLSVRHRTENITYTTLDGFNAVFRLYRALMEDTYGFRTLVVDNIHELYNLQMDKRLASPEGEDVADLRDYKVMFNYTRRMLRRARVLPIHTIMTVPDAITKEEATGSIYRSPKLPGQLATMVGGYFDVVGWLSVQMSRQGDNIKRVLQVQPFRRVVAKDRTGNLGPTMDDPTMHRIYQMTIGNKNIGG